MSREKFSWLCIAPAWLPAIMAFAACGLLEAASAPRIMAPISSGVDRFSWLNIRAMCRCVTWLSSCASTDASSSPDVVTLTSPRFSPSQPPGSAKALTERSLPSSTCQANRSSSSALSSPRARAASSNGCQMRRT